MLWAQDASMADEQVHVQGQLFQELKKRFPEVPDGVVASLMQKNDFVRERCIDALGRESKKYLNNGLSSPLRNLHIGGSPPDSHRLPRGGSDSSEGSLPHLPHPHQHHPSSSPGPASLPKHPAGDHSPNDMHFTSKTNFYLGGGGGGGGAGGGGDPQNGPYPGYDNPGLRQGATSGLWYHHPHPHHLPQTAHPSSSSSSSSTPIYPPGSLTQTPSPYPPQSLASAQPASLPPQPQYIPPWPYEGSPHTPLHRTGPPQSFQQRFPPAPQGYRTPSPQQPYPYQFDPSQSLHYRGTSPGSPPNTVYPPHSSSSSFPHHPTTATTTTSPTSNLWFLGQASGSGSNCSTPTRSPFPVFSPSPWPQGRYPLETEQLLHDVYTNQRRGSEDKNYTQALLQHQHARKEKLRHDLESCFLLLEKLRQENLEMERESAERRNQRSSTFPTAEDVGKTREENRRLLIDIQLMTREIDMFNNGQALLGVIDPQEQQSFYKNIGSTGQRGSIHAGDRTDRLPIEEEGSGGRVPPARPPPPNFLPTSGGISSSSGVGGGGGGLRPADVTPVDPGPPQDPDEGDNWSCSACTFLNHPALDHCECCEMPRLNSNNASSVYS